jgi:hypothetical protein
MMHFITCTVQRNLGKKDEICVARWGISNARRIFVDKPLLGMTIYR